MSLILQALQPARERDLVWSFAYSETDSVSRHGDTWRAALGPSLTRLVAEGDPARLQAKDWSIIRRTLLATRGSFMPSLLALSPSWHVGEIPIEDIGTIGLLRHPPFWAVAPTGHIDEFVAALDEGKDTPNDRFAGRYRALRDTFDPSRSRGRPAVVAPTLDGPFTEIDGLTRLSILWSRRIRTSPWPSTVAVLVGTGALIAHWPFY